MLLLIIIELCIRSVGFPIKSLLLLEPSCIDQVLGERFHQIGTFYNVLAVHLGDKTSQSFKQLVVLCQTQREPPNGIYKSVPFDGFVNVEIEYLRG